MGFVSSILTFFMKRKAERLLKNLAKDKDFKAAVSDLHSHSEKVKEMASDFEKKHGMSLDDWSKNRRKDRQLLS